MNEIDLAELKSIERKCFHLELTVGIDGDKFYLKDKRGVVLDAYFSNLHDLDFFLCGYLHGSNKV